MSEKQVSEWALDQPVLSPIVLGQGVLKVVIALDNHVLAVGSFAERVALADGIREKRFR